jgi:superkiller protein 3
MTDHKSPEEKRRQRAQRLSNRGADFMRRGEANNAVTVLERAYALIPDDVPTAINLGGAYILLKEFEKAIPILERALEREPENEMIWTNLGAAYLGNPILAGDERQCQAIAAFERAVEINPIAPNVHYNLALIHRNRGEIEQAKHRFRQAIQANPNDRDARRGLARLEERSASADQDGPPDGPA